MATAITGYGPSSRLYFKGDAESYDIWEVKFFAHLKLQNLLNVFVGDDPLPRNAENAEKNAKVYAVLIPLLDDKSISLVMREAKDDGGAAVGILREHYRGSSKPRVIALYTELTSLRMKESETTTDYVIRAEEASNSLKNAGEEISDRLLTAMVLKGLPSDYKSFCTVITNNSER